MTMLRNWLRRLVYGRVWDEARDSALANAAMVAHDMGRPDIRQAINRLIPVESPCKPHDSHDDAYGGSK